MLKVYILVCYTHCNGQAYIQARDAVGTHDNPCIMHSPCPYYLGIGEQARWVDQAEFASMLFRATCPHRVPYIPEYLDLH
jgi:hypothetical protein